MPCSNANSEEGESVDPSWIPLSELKNHRFAFNQNEKIMGIAEKVLGDTDDREKKLIAMLKRRLGADQESQYLFDQIINIFKSKNQ